MIPATTLAETIAALEARVAEAKKWVARQVAWETAYRLAQEAKDRAEKAEAEIARLLRRESFLIHAAWTAGREAQRAHKTEDCERIRARADAMESKS